MTKDDSPLPVDPNLNLLNDATRRLVADSGFVHLAKDASTVQAMMRDMALAIDKSSVFSGYSKMIEDLATTSRTIAFQNKPLFEALTLNAEQMRHAFASYAPKFELFGNAVVEMESRFISSPRLITRINFFRLVHSKSANHRNHLYSTAAAYAW
jgi:hypothetical protein